MCEHFPKFTCAVHTMLKSTKIFHSNICLKTQKRKRFSISSTLAFHAFDFSCVVKLLLVTYVVCERLSVMHEPAGVVENLVQILQNTPPPPPKMKIVRNLGTLTFQFEHFPKFTCAVHTMLKSTNN